MRARQQQINYKLTGTISQAQEGYGHAVMYEGHLYAILGQSSTLGSLEVGQRVLFEMTHQGAVVTDTYIQPQDSLAHDKLSWRWGQSSIEISQDGTIRLANPRARVLLEPDGRVRLQGYELQQEAEHAIRLDTEGSIELN